MFKGLLPHVSGLLEHGLEVILNLIVLSIVIKKESISVAYTEGLKINNKNRLVKHSPSSMPHELQGREQGYYL